MLFTGIYAKIVEVLKAARYLVWRDSGGQVSCCYKERTMETRRKKTGMSLADHIFIDMCKDVIENGTSKKGRRSGQCGRMALLLIRSNVLVL